MRALVWVTLGALLPGCNLILGLDPAELGADASPGSDCPRPGDGDFVDEDGDEIDDTCDRCPADADPEQNDGDQDGVGDACDVTDTPTQIVFFDGFHAPTGRWDTGGAGWSVVDDAVELDDSTDGNTLATLTVVDLSVTTGLIVAPLTIRALPASALDHLTGVVFDVTPGGAYLCAADERGITEQADGMIYALGDNLLAPVAGPSPLPGTFAIDQLVTPTATFQPGQQQCSVDMDGAVELIGSSVANLDGSVGLYASGVAIRVPYVIVYEESP
jgi:hypothetical protein